MLAARGNRGDCATARQTRPYQYGGKLMITMLVAVVEMERDLLVERTQSGLERAKAEGKTLGRAIRTTPEQRRRSSSDIR